MTLTVKYDLYVDETDQPDGFEGIRVVELPAHYEVCSRCRGEGKHVNPSIDGHGIGQEEFDADPDFREAYFSGRYDVPCEVCGGLRVVVVEDDPETFSEALKAQYEALLKQWEDEAADARLSAMERRMGA
jgi:hypothetical protein